jgi:GT2 family glycosyltransferase
VSEEALTLSVVVPVYNAGPYLERCLRALAASDYHDYEVLVVDDGSTEPVEPSVARFGFRYLRIDGPGGPARARNRGVAAAVGRYVAFVDSDVCVHRDALGRMVSALDADQKLAAVIGSYDDVPGAPDFISQYKNLFHHFVHQRSAGAATTFWSGCGAVRRDLFLELRGFDEVRYRRPSIEDIELGTSMTAAGHRILLDGAIRGTHLKRWTLPGLVRTDVAERGIPWVRLMWRSGAAAGTLNVSPKHRASVVLAYGAVFAAVAAGLWPAAAIVAAAAGATVTVVNRDLYSFFAHRKGIWFAIRVVPLHWLYLGYCGASVVLGTLGYLLFDRGERQPSLVTHGRRRRHQL